ncbi:hypothetical protein EBR21_00185 [bacterium]|nr:hypothetical protein [bacterium]
MRNKLHILGKLLPWISLAWGVVSAILISHNTHGIHKFLFFSGLFALAGIAGLVIIPGRSRLFDWLRLVSQQSSAQYILFFALPLLWKASNWRWMLLTAATGLSTLWDPWFNTLWQKSWYRRWILVVCMILLSGLVLVTWSPSSFRSGPLILLLCCLAGHVIVTFNNWREQNHVPDSNKWRGNKSFLALFLTDTWKFVVLAGALLLTSTPVPPLGVWIADGRVTAQPVEQSMECETRISAPAGFKSEVIHLWEFDGRESRSEEVSLPEIVGNGINQKPYRTLSRKKSFAFPFQRIVQSQIHCTVVLPGMGPVGRVSYRLEGE